MMIHDFANSATVIVAVILAVAGVLKLSSRASGSSETALGSVLRSETLTRAIWLVVAGVEVSIGALLLVQPGFRMPLAGAMSLFVVGGAYLVWAALRRPGRPCGCFGVDGAAGISARELVRVAVLASLATFAFFERGRVPSLQGPAYVWIPSILGLLAIVQLSPEIAKPTLSAALTRLRRRPDCLKAALPIDSALGALKKSETWTSLRGYLASDRFVDNWRVGCWRLFAFDGVNHGAPVTAVFAVRLERPAFTGAIVDSEKDEILVQSASGAFDAAIDLERFTVTAEAAA
jgi:hypothetical protein